MGSDGTGVRTLAKLTGRPRRTSWSPDGKWIAFTTEVDGTPELHVVPITGGKTRRLTTGGAVEIAWQPGK